MDEFVFIDCDVDALFPDSSKPLVIHRIGHASGAFMMDCRLMAITYAPIMPEHDFWLIPASVFETDVAGILQLSQARLREIISNAVVDTNGMMFNKRSMLFERIPS